MPVFQDLPNVDMNCDVDADRFVPSVEEQNLLMNELVFIVASSVISNLPQMRAIFERYTQSTFIMNSMTKLEKKQSRYAGILLYNTPL